MTQEKKGNNEESLSTSDQGSDVEDAVMEQYTFPLRPERREKIAKAFQRRTNTGIPNDPIITDGW